MTERLFIVYTDEVESTPASVRLEPGKIIERTSKHFGAIADALLSLDGERGARSPRSSRTSAIRS